jgi:hypothetical protein
MYFVALEIMDARDVGPLLAAARVNVNSSCHDSQALPT